LYCTSEAKLVACCFQTLTHDRHTHDHYHQPNPTATPTPTPDPPSTHLPKLLSFTAFTLLFQHEDWSVGFRTMISNPYGASATACSVLCVLAMLPFLYMDGCTLIAYSSGWAASPWNM